MEWMQKNHKSDFCYEFIYELNLYEFICMSSQEIIWFRRKSTQKQLYSINLNAFKP